MYKTRIFFTLFLSLLICGILFSNSTDCKDVQKLIDDWRVYCEDSGELWLSDYTPIDKARMKSHPFYDWSHRIIAEGPPAVPCLLDNILQIEQKHRLDLSEFFRDLLIFTVKQILKIELNARIVANAKNKTWRTYYLEFPEIYVENDKEYDHDRTKQILLKFWRQKDQLIKSRFVKLNQERKKFLGDEIKTQKILKEIENLGILALPLLVEEIAKGEDPLIQIVAELTDGQVAEDASPTACLAWWAANKSYWTME